MQHCQFTLFAVFLKASACGALLSETLSFKPQTKVSNPQGCGGNPENVNPKVLEARKQKNPLKNKCHDFCYPTLAGEAEAQVSCPRYHSRAKAEVKITANDNI